MYILNRFYTTPNLRRTAEGIKNFFFLLRMKLCYGLLPCYWSLRDNIHVIVNGYLEKQLNA